ncbi:MAG: hypothetical protein AAF533_28505 [Acidobacteriota bacterium]
MVEHLDRLHRFVVSRPILSSFTLMTRLMLAIGFIPPGMTKVLGRPFTRISPDVPIGAFFETFLQSGLYYGFVGGSQVLAGLLLLWPRTALLGALLYLPIIANIFVITVSMRFGGTWVVTGLMLLACLFLVCWDYDRWRAVPFPQAPPLPDDHRFTPSPESAPRLWRFAVVTTLVALLGAAGFFLAAASLAPTQVALPGMALAAIGFPLSAAAWWRFGVRARAAAQV